MPIRKNTQARMYSKFIITESSDEGKEFIKFLQELRDTDEKKYNKFIKDALRAHYYHVKFSSTNEQVAFLLDSDLTKNEIDNEPCKDSEEIHRDVIVTHDNVSSVASEPSSLKPSISNDSSQANENNHVESNIPSNQQSHPADEQVRPSNDKDSIESGYQFSDDEIVNVDDSLLALLALDDDDDIP